MRFGGAAMVALPSSQGNPVFCRDGATDKDFFNHNALRGSVPFIAERFWHGSRCFKLRRWTQITEFFLMARLPVIRGFPLI